MTRITTQCSQTTFQQEPMSLRPEATAEPSVGPALWCAICQVAGKHMNDNFHFLQKFVQTPHPLFYNFYQSVGHDEHNC